MRNFMLEAVEVANAVEEEQLKEEQARYLEEKRRLEDAVFAISGRHVKAADDLTITLDEIQFQFDSTSSLIARIVCKFCGSIVHSRVVDDLNDVGNLIRDSVGRSHR
jgi:hypothetical protein